MAEQKEKTVQKSYRLPAGLAAYIDELVALQVLGSNSSAVVRTLLSNAIQDLDDREIIKKHKKIGLPARDKISTAYVERQNLTMRMQMRRFTRLTNGFSKKVANLHHAVALHFMYYNFCRVHQTLGVTPAMAARVSDYPWTLEELAVLTERAQMDSAVAEISN